MFENAGTFVSCVSILYMHWIRDFDSLSMRIIEVWFSVELSPVISIYLKIRVESIKVVTGVHFSTDSRESAQERFCYYSSHGQSLKPPETETQNTSVDNRYNFSWPGIFFLFCGSLNVSFPYWVHYAN